MIPVREFYVRGVRWSAKLLTRWKLRNYYSNGPMHTHAQKTQSQNFGRCFIRSYVHSLLATWHRHRVRIFSRLQQFCYFDHKNTKMSPVPANEWSGTMNSARIECNKLFQQQHRLPPISVIFNSNLGKMRISRMNWFCVQVHPTRTIDKCQLIKLPLECFFCVWNPIKLNAWARE